MPSHLCEMYSVVCGFLPLVAKVFIQFLAKKRPTVALENIFLTCVCVGGVFVFFFFFNLCIVCLHLHILECVTCQKRCKTSNCEKCDVTEIWNKSLYISFTYSQGRRQKYIGKGGGVLGGARKYIRIAELDTFWLILPSVIKEWYLQWCSFGYISIDVYTRVYTFHCCKIHTCTRVIKPPLKICFLVIFFIPSTNPNSCVSYSTPAFVSPQILKRVRSIIFLCEVCPCLCIAVNLYIEHKYVYS